MELSTRVAHESHIILLRHKRSHLEREHHASKDFSWVEGGKPCFPAPEPALVFRMLKDALFWDDVGRAGIGVMKGDG